MLLHIRNPINKVRGAVAYVLYGYQQNTTVVHVAQDRQDQSQGIQTKK